MSAYAHNASAGGGGGYASLTGSLLARKGEALPAVDAVAHEGVDIEMRPMQPANSPGGPKNISEDAIETLRPRAADSRLKRRMQPEARRGSVRLVHPAPSSSSSPPSGQTHHRPAPHAWTIMSQTHEADDAPQRPRLSPPSGTSRGDRQASSGRAAICKLRMPAPDLVRLRFASRDMEMSCQAIILEALECYLDANDVPPISDDAIQQEIERLLSKVKKR